MQAEETRYLNNLLAFVKSHDMVDPRIVGESVVFGIEEVWPEVPGEEKRRVTVAEVTVHTFKQARDELGY